MPSATETAILDAIDTGSAIARAIAPQFTAYIVLGTAIAKAAPQLYDDVVKLLHMAEPTPEEKADLASKLHALANPETA